MTTLAKFGLVCLVTASVFSGNAADSIGSGKNDYTRTARRPYEEVLTALKQAAQAHGFRVSNVHDIAASLHKDGIQREPYVTVEVCNSRIAAQVLEAEPLLGSIMPCRIAVFQKGNETTISMIRPSKLMTLFPVKAVVKKEANEVEHSMKAIVDEATR